MALLQATLGVERERVMDVKEAVRTAREYIADLFEEEHVSDLGLEEVVFNNLRGEWRITIGFSRPWNRENAPRSLGEARSYKMVCLSDKSGKVTSVKDRLLTAAR